MCRSSVALLLEPGTPQPNQNLKFFKKYFDRFCFLRNVWHIFDANTCLSSAYGICSALRTQVLNTLLLSTWTSFGESITKRERGCVLSGLLWFPLSNWHQYATPVLADLYKGAGRKRGAKAGWNYTKWDSMLMLLLLWTPMAKLWPCRSRCSLFKKNSDVTMAKT